MKKIAIVFVIIVHLALLAWCAVMYIANRYSKPADDNAVSPEVEKELTRLEKSVVLLFSNKHLIGGGVLYRTDVRGEMRELVITARHVLELARKYAHREGYFNLAIASSSDGEWHIEHLPINGARWFDGGAEVDLAVLDISPLCSELREKGANLSFIESYADIKDGELFALCPDVYRDLAAERIKSGLHSPIISLFGKVKRNMRIMSNDAIVHPVILADFDNFMKPGYSGSPVFARQKDAPNRLVYVGNLILAVNKGNKAGVSPIAPLIRSL